MSQTFAFRPGLRFTRRFQPLGDDFHVACRLVPLLAEERRDPNWLTRAIRTQFFRDPRLRYEPKGTHA